MKKSVLSLLSVLFVRAKTLPAGEEKDIKIIADT